MFLNSSSFVSAVLVREAKIIAKSGPNVIPVTGSFEGEDHQRVIEQIQRKVGHIDVVVQAYSNLAACPI